MQYAAVMTRGSVVTPDYLPPTSASMNGPPDLSSRIRELLLEWATEQIHMAYPPLIDGLHGVFLNEFESPILQAALNATDGNRSAAAELLGLHRETLRKRLRPE